MGNLSFSKKKGSPCPSQENYNLGKKFNAFSYLPIVSDFPLILLSAVENIKRFCGDVEHQNKRDINR